MPRAATVSKKKDLLIEADNIKQAWLVMKAIYHPVRQKLLKLVNKNGEMKVSDIYRKLKRTQSETSMHLAILRRAEAVNFRKDSKKVYYSVNHNRLAEIEAKAAELLNIED